MDKKITSIDSHRPYPKESELAKRLDLLIHEYDGELSTVAVCGVLDMLKIELTLFTLNGE